eukprot:6213488-Pleurochrysis_carterae.AAC.1
MLTARSMLTATGSVAGALPASDDVRAAHLPGAARAYARPRLPSVSARGRLPLGRFGRLVLELEVRLHLWQLGMQRCVQLHDLESVNFMSPRLSEPTVAHSASSRHR